MREPHERALLCGPNSAAALTAHDVCCEVARPGEVRLSEVFHPTASASAPDFVAREVREVLEHRISLATNGNGTAAARVVVLASQHLIAGKRGRVLEVHLFAATAVSSKRGNTRERAGCG